MTEAQQIALLALVCVAAFIEYAARDKKMHMHVKVAAEQIARAILPKALFNPAPRLNTRELRALKRRVEAKRSQRLVSFQPHFLREIFCVLSVAAIV